MGRLSEWFARFERRINQPLGYSPDALAKKLQGLNFAEAEEFGLSVYRRFVLGQPDSDMKAIVDASLRTLRDRTVRSPENKDGEP